MQLQVSKLDSFASVDLNSTHWMELPNATREDTFTFGYTDKVNFLLGNFNFEDPCSETVCYVTGLQLDLFDFLGKKVVSARVIGKELLRSGDDVILGMPYSATINKNQTNFVPFTLSDVKVDGAQNVEPLFDIQEIVLDNPLPLTGINFYYYETIGNTLNKFITPQLRAFDASFLINQTNFMYFY